MLQDHLRFMKMKRTLERWSQRNVQLKKKQSAFVFRLIEKCVKCWKYVNICYNTGNEGNFSKWKWEWIMHFWWTCAAYVSSILICSLVQSQIAYVSLANARHYEGEKLNDVHPLNRIFPHDILNLSVSLLNAENGTRTPIDSTANALHECVSAPDLR